MKPARRAFVLRVMCASEREFANLLVSNEVVRRDASSRRPSAILLAAFNQCQLVESQFQISVDAVSNPSYAATIALSAFGCSTNKRNREFLIAEHLLFSVAVSYGKNAALR